MNVVPEEDKNICDHSYRLMDIASGFAAQSANKYVLYFYCQRCLYFRKRVVDVSDQHLNPEFLREFEDDNGEAGIV